MKLVQVRRRLLRSLLYLALTMFFITDLIPFIWTFLTSLKTSGDVIAAPLKLTFTPTLENYRAVLFQDFSGEIALANAHVNVMQAFVNSVVIAGGATIVGLILSNFAAFALARFRMPEKEFYAFFLLTFRFSPVFVFIIPLFIIYQRIHLYNTYYGLIFVYQIIVIPLAVWVMRSFYESIPADIFEAGAVDGASWMQMLWQIALPLAAPGLATTAILSFIACWNNFVFPLLLGAASTQTVTLATITFIGYEQVAWGMMTAAAIVTILPELFLALLVQRYIVRGLSYGAVKG